MKTIGLIGGMSAESSAVYYATINRLVRERSGGLHSARSIMYSVDFADIAEMQPSGQWDAAGQLLASAARSLEHAGAEMILLCTNTMHKVIDDVASSVSIPCLSIIDVVASAAKSDDVKALGVLGTSFTMEDSFYRDALVSAGLEVLVPPAADRDEVHRIIYEELCRGTVTEESREMMRGVVDRLRVAGAEAVVLACTELEMLLDDDSYALPLMPSAAMHASAAVDAALSPS